MRITLVGGVAKVRTRSGVIQYSNGVTLQGDKFTVAVNGLVREFYFNEVSNKFGQLTPEALADYYAQNNIEFFPAG